MAKSKAEKITCPVSHLYGTVLLLYSWTKQFFGLIVVRLLSFLHFNVVGWQEGLGHLAYKYIPGMSNWSCIEYFIQTYNLVLLAGFAAVLLIRDTLLTTINVLWYLYWLPHCVSDKAVAVIHTVWTKQLILIAMKSGVSEWFTRHI